MTRSSYIRRSRGFSLIELMIALALFGLIASGAMSLVMSGARSQARSARVDEAQSGLRAAIDFMTRDILGAGSGVRSTNLYLGSSGALIPVIQWVDSATGANTPDTIELYTIDGSAINTTGIPVTPMAGVPNGFSSLTVDNPAPLNVGDWVQIGDLSTAVLAKISAKGAASLTFTGANSTPPSGAYGPLPATATCIFKSRHVKYSVVATEFSGASSGSVANGSALMLDLFDGAGGASNPQPLAEGVEDLQIALGIDTNLDGTVIEVIGSGANIDEWVGNAVGEVQPLDLTKLRAIRFTITAKATMSDRNVFPARPAAEDRTAGTADGFFRRVIRTEVAVRNFNL